MSSYFLFALLFISCVFSTPLDDYVALNDGCFQYQDLNVTIKGLGWTGHIWNLTSQCWLNSSLVDRTVWWHHLVVVIPDVINPQAKSFGGLLYITGNSNNNPNDYPSATDEDIIVCASIAVASKTVGAVLYQVPNQPLTFPWDPWHVNGRSEDAAIAITWWHFVVKDPSQPYYILELPMAKSAVKALDALEVIFPKYTNGVVPSEFYVAGASKRGWTTWLVGVVDAVTKKRVGGIIPIVLDALNFREFAHRQWRSYGAWSFALQDYYAVNFTAYFDAPNTHTMQTIIDPYFYKERLTMAKLALNAGGDEFQLVDDQRFWAKDMPGEMNTLLVKNAEHSMVTGVLECLQSAGAFVQGLMAKYPRPTYSWDIDATTGRITLTTGVKPKSVSVAYAVSGGGISQGKRDFRWAALNATPCIAKVFGACVRPILWFNTNATVLSDTSYTALIPPPAGAWVAFMIEVQFDNPVGVDPFYFSTPASVLPIGFPFPDCTGAACRGTLC
eukprot:PhF_6_TR11541/c0_g1_i2/m.18534